jgi:hypothetical protein
LKQLKGAFGIGRIEVAGWFVGQNYPQFIRQCARFSSIPLPGPSFFNKNGLGPLSLYQFLEPSATSDEFCRS